MTKPIEITSDDLAATLPEVLRRVDAGVEFIVTRAGKPVARLASASAATSPPLDAIPIGVNEGRARYAATRVPAPEGALAQLVSAPTLRRVLGVFLLEPTAEVHQREIARRTSAGLRSVQLAAKRLVTLGLLGERRDGNRLYYHAIRSERFEQVRALLAREFGIAEVLSRHLLQAEKPVEWAFIFGSAATGEDRVGSDIDLLVVTEATDDELVAPIAAAQRELGRDIDMVSYRPDEFARKQAEGNHFVRSVLAQPRFDIIGGDSDA